MKVSVNTAKMTSAMPNSEQGKAASFGGQSPQVGHTRAWLLALAVGLLCCALAINWWRTGRVPAASCGDEMWWSESAYWFLKEGTLRWDCMNDDRGCAVVSYWPPAAPLLQAL